MRHNVPESPVDQKPAPVSFQKMEVDISAVKAEMEALEATIKNAKLEMEMDRFIPGTTGDTQPVNVGNEQLDPQSVKAKLRQKLQRKSEEAKLMQDMQKTLAEDVNATAEQIDQQGHEKLRHASVSTGGLSAYSENATRYWSASQQGQSLETR